MDGPEFPLTLAKEALPGGVSLYLAPLLTSLSAGCLFLCLLSLFPLELVLAFSTFSGPSFFFNSTASSKLMYLVAICKRSSKFFSAFLAKKVCSSPSLRHWIKAMTIRSSEAPGDSRVAVVDLLKKSSQRLVIVLLHTEQSLYGP